jgi:hypothetical protein
MNRPVLPSGMLWRRRWRFVSGNARIEGRTERELRAGHRTQCTLCGAQVLPDGTGHDTKCWGLPAARASPPELESVGLDAPDADRLARFALLVTLGDRDRASALSKDAALTAAAQARALDDAHLDGAGLRRELVRRLSRAPRRVVPDHVRWEALESLRVSDIAYAGLAALTPRQRAAIVAGVIERATPEVLAATLKVDRSRAVRLVAQATRRYLRAATARGHADATRGGEFSRAPHSAVTNWLVAGAADEPPRTATLHAAGCQHCARTVAAFDDLTAIQIGAPSDLPLAEPTLPSGRLAIGLLSSVAAAFFAVVVLTGLPTTGGLIARDVTGAGPQGSDTGGTDTDEASTPESSPSAGSEKDGSGGSADTPGELSEATPLQPADAGDGSLTGEIPTVGPGSSPPGDASAPGPTPAPGSPATPAPTPVPGSPATPGPTPLPPPPTPEPTLLPPPPTPEPTLLPPPPTPEPTPAPASECSDGVDNDGDLLTDLADLGCLLFDDESDA